MRDALPASTTTGASLAEVPAADEAAVPEKLVLPVLAPGLHSAGVRYRYAEAIVAVFARDIPLPGRLRDAVLARRIDFLAGRRCALDALRAAGCAAPVALAVGVRGAPCWPAGYAGSISHDDGWAVAAACPLAIADGVGVDVQRRLAADACAEIRAQVASDADLAAGAPWMPVEAWLTLLFSAKESLFKALHARAGRYFEFRDVAVHAVDPARAVLALRLCTAVGGATRAGDVHDVAWHWLGERVLTCCTTRARG